MAKWTIVLLRNLMKVIRIIVQIGILNVFYYLGLGIVTFFSLPLPASVIGLLLLSLALHYKLIKVEYIQDGAGFLIGVLTLFFIPATVGVIDYPQLWSMSGLIIIVSVTVSTLIAIYVTGVLSQVIEKREFSKKEEMLKKEGITVE